MVKIAPISKLMFLVARSNASIDASSLFFRHDPRLRHSLATAADLDLDSLPVLDDAPALPLLRSAHQALFPEAEVGEGPTGHFWTKPWTKRLCLATGWIATD